MTAVPEPLLPGEVHVWVIRDDGGDAGRPGGWDDLSDFRTLALLDAGDRRELAALVAPAARRQFVRGRALARRTLSRYAPRSPAAWRFRRGPWGKPEIASDDEDDRDLGDFVRGAAGVRISDSRSHPESPRLYFNVTHTRGLTACAVARAPGIGVDAEDTSREVEAVEIARGVFADVEIADVEATPASRRIQRFYRYWTVREAFVKATGRGFSRPATRYAFALRPGGRVELSLPAGDPDGAVGWHFHQRRLSPRHLLAVAVSDPAPAVSVVVRSAEPAGHELYPEET